jgi:ADP-heptose:LPS heptosyltransferase
MSIGIRYGLKKQLAARLMEVIFFILAKPFNLFRKKGEIRKILLIEPFQMGDIAALSALFSPLKSRFPEAGIYIAGKKGPVMLATCMEDVEAVYPIEFPWSRKNKEKGSWMNWLKQSLSLRNHHFDLGIDVRGDVRSQATLVLAGCASVLSFRRYIYSDIRVSGLLCDYSLEESPYSHVFERNRYLLSGIGIPEDALFPIQFPLFRVAGEIPHHPIVLHVGAGWEYRNWPAASWAALISSLRKYPGIEPIIVAAPGDEQILEKIAAFLKKDAMPEVLFTSLPDLCRILTGAGIFIGSDSGPMAISNCLQSRQVSIFGPGLPDVWRPYSKKSVFLHEAKGYDCYPCTQTFCQRAADPCVGKVSTELVLEATKRVLSEHA